MNKSKKETKAQAADRKLHKELRELFGQIYPNVLTDPHFDNLDSGFGNALRAHFQKSMLPHELAKIDTAQAFLDLLKIERKAADRAVESKIIPLRKRHDRGCSKCKKRLAVKNVKCIQNSNESFHYLWCTNEQCSEYHKSAGKIKY